MPPRKKARGTKTEQLALLFPARPEGFPALPLDILFEIFSLLLPLDLLHLTRTTKPFRRFLLNRANAAIWQAAFATSASKGGPPGCPAYMSEPAWTRVAFEKMCHICSATLRDDANTDSVWWEFGARYCGDCMGSQVSSTITVKLKRLDPNLSWEHVLPRVPRNLQSSRWYYLIAHQRDLMDLYLETEDEELRAAIIHDRQTQTGLIMDHSKLCRDWARKQIQDKRIAAREREVNRHQHSENRRIAKETKDEEAKKSRLEAIVSKLTALGWSDKPWMNSGSLSAQIRHYPLVQVPKMLGAHEFVKMETGLISQLNADKHNVILEQNLKVFRQAFPLIITPAELAGLTLDVPPTCTDLVLIPAIRVLLEEEAEASIPTNRLVETLRPLMPTLLKTWVAETVDRIALHARKSLNLEHEDVPPGSPDPLALAIALVGCPKCHAVRYFSSLLRPDHSCPNLAHSPNSTWLHQSAFSWGSSSPKEEESPYERLVRNAFYGKPFTPTVLRFGVRLQAFEDVVRAFGRDPKIATFREMAQDRRLVRCGICVAKAGKARKASNLSAPSLDWLQAMHHDRSFHPGVSESDETIVWEFSGTSRDSDVKV
ncbi:hypothetical protein C8R43DRAFT_997893 [Mycena crocata]|nr:hypothetical protein C8R43DRAFT_997893 [Mycena crocata]